MKYADDHQEHIFPNVNYREDDRSKTWVRGSRGNGPHSDDTNTLWLTDSLISPYLGRSVAVWKCPGDPSTSRLGSKTLRTVRSYSMQAWMNMQEKDPNNRYWTDSPYKVYRRIADIIRPVSVLRGWLSDVGRFQPNRGPLKVFSESEPSARV